MIASNQAASTKVRYAVVGLGHIAQAAVLPAFEHAQCNSELVALISDDPVKLSEVGDQYGVSQRYGYDQYEECLGSGQVDAVYIALPNHLHCTYSVRAAQAGCHVLCEKPMAVTEAECREMIDAARQNNVKLMVAYRLHFESANLEAIEVVRSGAIGEPRFFNSVFSMQARAGGIRLKQSTGGGTLYDIGIYCINAARYLFRDEPEEVFCTSVSGADMRFGEVDEMSSVVMRFPGGRLATFTSSFGAADVDAFRIVGTRGELRVEPAYAYRAKLTHHLQSTEQVRRKSFAERDQFAPELKHFSNCILSGTEPEPSGLEGLADVRIIEALYRSAKERRAIEIEAVGPLERPSEANCDYEPPVEMPDLVHVESPSFEE